jgi:hypothetical protein
MSITNSQNNPTRHPRTSTDAIPTSAVPSRPRGSTAVEGAAGLMRNEPSDVVLAAGARAAGEANEAHAERVVDAVREVLEPYDE